MNQVKNIKVGLIGFGFMGTTHWDIYAGLKGVEVTALADVDPAKRRGDVSAVVGNIGKRDNSKPIDLSNVSVYADPFELIGKADVDIVDICVPTPYHADLVVAALKAGKNVFCEKPLCRTAAEMKRILTAAKKAKGFFNVGLCVRAFAEYRHAWEYFTSGKAGKLRYAAFRRFSPSVAGNAWKDWYMDGKLSGGALLDLHIHDVDEVNYFFGKPKSVQTSGVNVVSKGGMDHVLARYDYGNGKLVLAEGGWIEAKGTPFEANFTIVCDKATLKLDASGYHIYRTDGKVLTPKLANPKLPTGWHHELAYFADCVRKGVKPTKYQTLASVETTMKMVFAEEKSVAAKKAVKI